MKRDIALILAILLCCLIPSAHASVSLTRFNVTSSKATAKTFMKVTSTTASTADSWNNVIFRSTFDDLSKPSSRIVLPDGSRRDLLTRGTITYGVYQAQRNNVNLLEWNNIWGYNNSTAPSPVAWPGVGGSAPVMRSFKSTSYISAHFKTGSNTSLNGFFSNPSYIAPPNPDAPERKLLVTMSISRYPGDFSIGLPTPGCLVRDAGSDSNVVLYKFTTNAPGSYCNLQTNTDYWVNWVISHPEGCKFPMCLTGTVSYHN